MISYASRILNRSFRRHGADALFVFLVAMAFATRFVYFIESIQMVPDPLVEHNTAVALVWFHGGDHPASAPLPGASHSPLGVYLSMGAIVLLWALRAFSPVSAGFVALLRADSVRLIVLQRSLGLLLSIWTLCWMYGFLKKRYGPGAARLALLLGGLSPLVVRAGGWGCVENLVAWLVLLCLERCAEIYTRGRTRAYLFAGVFAALAVACQLHCVALLLPVCGAHFLTTRLPRKGILGRLVEGRFLALGVIFFALVVALYFPVILRFGLPVSLSGEAHRLLNDELPRACLLQGGALGGIDGVRCLARESLGEILSVFGLLLLLFTFLRRGMQELRLPGVYVACRLILVGFAPGPVRYSIVPEVLLLAWIVSANVMASLGRLRWRSTEGIAVVVSLLVAASPAYILWREGQGMSLPHTRDYVYRWLKRRKVSMPQVAQLGRIVTRLGGARSLRVVPAGAMGAKELLAFWSRNLPTAAELHSQGVRYVVLDLSLYRWLVAHDPGGGDAWKALRTSLRGAGKRVTLRAKSEKARGPVIEIYSL